MKNLTFTLCLLFALSLSVVAQNAPQNEAVEKTSASVTKLMVQAVGLNESEYIQVRALNKERLAKAAEVARMHKDDEQVRQARLREIDEEFENKLFRILSTRQLEAYAEFKTKPEGNFLSMVDKVSSNGKN